MTQIQGQSGLGVTLTKVSNVQSQVVNGINYKMVLHFADSDDKNVIYVYLVTVYVPPGGEPTLESYTPLLQWRDTKLYDYDVIYIIIWQLKKINIDLLIL